MFIFLLCFGCVSHKDQFEDVADQLIRYYEQEDSNPQKVECVRYISDNIKWHYIESGDMIYPDSETVTFDFLKEHIDYIYNVWKTSKFSKGLNFEDFKEYLLPYCAYPGIGPNITSKARAEFMKQHVGCGFDSISEVVASYNRVISELRNGEHFQKKGVGRQGLEDLRDTIFTDCSDRAHHCVLNLRSLGIPCVLEQNNCYRKLVAHHVHCAIFDPATKRFYRFNAEDTDSYPDSTGWNFVEMQNIYRHTYADQYTTPYYMKQINESILHSFASPCIKEVTRKSYYAEMKIKVPKGNNIVYLSTFNKENNGLVPVTWGLTDSTHTQATFNNVLPTTLYFPGIADSGIFKVISNPIYFTLNEGSLDIHEAEFIGDSQGQTESVTLGRKYPVKEKTFDIISELKGCRIEASNDSMFANSILLKILDCPLNIGLQRISLNNDNSYRYYRLISPRDTKTANISILRWVDSSGRTHVGDKSNRAYDEDETTAPKDSREITITFARPEGIRAIDIAPLSAGNSVMAGHKYQLRYYDRKQCKWILLKTMDALDKDITFEKVPKGSLLWLSDLTGGREEMPFIYRDNKQVFLYPELISTLP